MNQELDWKTIRRVIAGAPFCSIASIDEDGRPRVTPIGSVYLKQGGKGFFLERFTSGLPLNIDRQSPISLMAVNTSATFWLGGLIAGRFKSPPAIRLRGTAGPRREATEEERDIFTRRVSKLRWTRGHRKLWRDFCYARDLDFSEQIPMRLGTMWGSKSGRGASKDG